MSIIDCNYSVTGSGPAIFLTHGVGGAEDAWRFITPKLKSMFTGPGKVKEGNIEALPRKQTLEELKENL